MVWIINQRTEGHAGGIAAAACWASAGGAAPSYTVVPLAQVAAATAGKQVVVAIHGFNVNRPSAVRAYVTLERELALSDDQIFFGACWPGDGWIPVVNYPWEASDAVKCGRYLAEYLTAAMPDAGSLNFISHSLGGRVLLETIRALGRKAGEVCITAGAVDDDVLARQYVTVKDKARRISVLASGKDKVLGAAYPLGDLVSDVFLGDKDSPWRGALGRKGPRPVEASPPVNHRQIASPLGYGHGDYFPPSDPAVTRALWKRSVAYMRRALNGDADGWS